MRLLTTQMPGRGGKITGGRYTDHLKDTTRCLKRSGGNLMSREDERRVWLVISTFVRALPDVRLRDVASHENIPSRGSKSHGGKSSA
jgi:hypothetical protein